MLKLYFSMFSAAFFVASSPGLAALSEPAPPMPAGAEMRAIGERIREHQIAVQDCYEDRLSAIPGLKGRVIAVFDIGPDGKVIDAITEGIDDPPLLRCLQDEILRWHFAPPASGGKLRVAFPWTFRPLG